MKHSIKIATLILFISNILGSIVFGLVGNFFIGGILGMAAFLILFIILIAISINGG